MERTPLHDLSRDELIGLILRLQKLAGAAAVIFMAVTLLPDTIAEPEAAPAKA